MGIWSEDGIVLARKQLPVRIGINDTDGREEVTRFKRRTVAAWSRILGLGAVSTSILPLIRPKLTGPVAHQPGEIGTIERNPMNAYAGALAPTRKLEILKRGLGIQCARIDRQMVDRLHL